MAAYSLDVLIRKWGREELSLEQAIGQLLLIVQKLDQRISILEGRKSRPHRRPVSKAQAKEEQPGKDASDAEQASDS